MQKRGLLGGHSLHTTVDDDSRNRCSRKNTRIPVTTIARANTVCDVANHRPLSLQFKQTTVFCCICAKLGVLTFCERKWRTA